MPQSQNARRTPLATDPVGSLVGEFMEEKRKERQEEKARQTPRKRNPLVVPFLLALCLANNRARQVPFAVVAVTLWLLAKDALTVKTFAPELQKRGI